MRSVWEGNVCEEYVGGECVSEECVGGECVRNV